MNNRWVVLVALLALTALSLRGNAQDTALPAGVYNTPGPHVVVNGTLLQAPVQMAQGSMLLPMRAVFEALQAQVQWFPQTQQITATRGAVAVQLWINRGTAMVNGREVTLAVPPTLYGDSTYVPLRFPAETFGGDVKWNAALQTAIITIQPVGDAATTPAAVNGTVKIGVLMRKTQDVFPKLVIQDPHTGTFANCILAANATIIRGAAGTLARSVDFGDVQPGDLVKVTLNADGNGSAVEAQYALDDGIVSEVTGDTIMLRNGTRYHLHHDVRFTNADGREIDRHTVVRGTPVSLRLTPGTTTVWQIRATTGHDEHAPAVKPDHHDEHAPVAKPEHHEDHAPVAKPEDHSFRIVAPANNERATKTLSIVGRAPAGMRVRVSVSYESSVSVVAVKGGVYKDTVIADRDGHWRTPPIDTTIPMVTADSYTVKAEMLNGKGDVMQINTLTLRGY